MVVHQLSWLWAFGWPALRACRSGRRQPDLRLRGGEARRGCLEHRAARPEPGDLLRGGAGEAAARPRRDSGNALRQLRRAWRGEIPLVADGFAAQRALRFGSHRADHHGAALAHAWGGPQHTVTLAGARHYGIERSDGFWNAVGEFLRQVESDPGHT